MKQETPTKRGATQDVSALEDAERNDLLSPMLDTDENANSEAGNLKWKQAARARRTRRKNNSCYIRCCCVACCFWRVLYCCLQTAKSLQQVHRVFLTVAQI